MEYRVSINFKLDLDTVDVKEAQSLVDELSPEELLVMSSGPLNVEVDK